MSRRIKRKDKQIKRKKDKNAKLQKDKKLKKIKNIPRIGKLPYGAKRGFIERRALLKEGLY